MPMQIGMNARSPVGLPRTGMHGLDALQQGRVGRGAGGRWPLARSSGLRPARTRSTICRRNSGEYGGRVLGIGSTSGERLRVSTKPGQS